MNENQFPTIHLDVFTRNIVSVHNKVDFVLVAQFGHCDGVDRPNLVIGEDGVLIIPIIETNTDILGKKTLEGDEIKSIAVDDD